MADYPLGELTTRELTHSRFPCEQCGALLKYDIGTTDLKCSYCGHSNTIVNSSEPILEYNIHHALRELERAKILDPEITVVRCNTCAAEFDLDPNSHAGECPYCGTTVVTGTGHVKPIKPKALLPFAISADQARDSYKKWLSGLWFAPNALKKYAREDQKLNGVYIPYWTYDSSTQTAYTGQRGDVYYVRQSYTAVVNGRQVRQTRMVPKIRWTPVSGRTHRHFDDVLVGASRSLPRQIMDWLQPWDLENLIPYTEAYLSGFNSEIYQVDLDEGFNRARQIMDNAIRSDVARAIGGDQQQIHSVNTQHSETTFKHVLLPLWSAAFRFRGKTYRFVVNGRNGKTRGERPWSFIKISLAVLAGGTVLTGFLFFAAANGNFSEFGSGFEQFPRSYPVPQYRN
ncbi:MAG: primosomal protein N' (replication factor Y) - superfamily II helicase [Gammaproteobacteria bacterium]|nr:primosomal protein N' (replication factor Y) - superfamily II helicase [Gammaproteobacteria bacterium]